MRRLRTLIPGRPHISSHLPWRHTIHSSTHANTTHIPTPTTPSYSTPTDPTEPSTAAPAITTPPDGRMFHLDLRPPRQQRVLFFGSDTFSLPTLQALLPSQPRPAVVCPADSKRGRGNRRQPLPVRSFANAQGLECSVVERDVDFRMHGWQLPVVEGGWDVGVVVSFGYMVPNRIIRAFRHGMINLHPSLLPQYRGATPIQHALWADDTLTGVSIIDLHPSRLDAGNILLQLSEPIAPTDTYQLLSARLAQLGSKAVLHTLNNLLSLRSTALQQWHSEGTKAPKLSNEWAALDFTQPARRVYAHWRASHGFNNAYTQWKGERLNIVEMDGYDAADPRQQQRLQVGDVRYDGARKVLCVQCGCGGSVLVSRLHVANKPRAIDATSFRNGNMNTAAARQSVRFEQPTTSADVVEWLMSTKDDRLTERIVDNAVNR